MLIRPARIDDAEAIRSIYNHEVLTSTVTFDIEPRSLEQQREWLTKRTGAHVVLVADVEGMVAGFASLSPYRDRAAYRTTVEDSVYVHRDFRGKGVGRRLLEELLERARGHGFHAVIARVVDGHLASIRLHESCGFERVGIEREVGRKFGRWLDVVVLERIL